MSALPQTHLTPLGDGVTAIDTDYVRPLFDASHLIVEDGKAAFVDTGTAHSVPLLLSALDELNIDRADVDWVMLTHIHLDHAGGAGSLMRELPNARALIHPRGARHMVQPEKLIAGSEAVYGKTKFAELYGEIVPIDEKRVVVAEEGQQVELASRQMQLIFTEGHARHHYCIIDPTSEGIFTGDSFGVSYREFDTTAGEFVIPTTTPVHFDPVAAHETIDRIVALAPQRAFLTHYSEVRDIERLAQDMHEGLDAFVAIAQRCATVQNRRPAIIEGIFDWISARLDAHGFDTDSSRRHAIIDMDIDLSAQGLEHWLDHAR